MRVPVTFAVLALAAGTAPLHAAPEPPRALLTYAIDLGRAGSGGGLCIARADGSRRLRLTPLHDDRSPAWSPRGRYVAFTRHTQGPTVLQLFIANARGRIIARLRDDAVFNQDPAWAPNGRSIAFVGSWRGASLALVGPDGRNRRDIHDAYALASPTWAPDSRRLAFAEQRFGEPWTIRIIDVRTGNLHPLAYDSTDPAWSPDGSLIAFVHDGDVLVGDADASHRERALTRTPERESNPAWSPGGRLVAFEREGVGIVVARSDGSGERVAIRDPRAREPAWRPPVPLPSARRAVCR